MVAQLLDYATNGSVFWTPGQLRGWIPCDDPDGAAERLAAFLAPSGDEPETSADVFWQAVGTNLRDGRIKLIFVTDQIPATLQRLAGFLNEQMPRVEVRRWRSTSTAPTAVGDEALASRSAFSLGSGSPRQSVRPRSLSPRRP